MRKVEYEYLTPFTTDLLKALNRERIRRKAIRCRMLEEQLPEYVEDDDRLKKRRVKNRHCA